MEIKFDLNKFDYALNNIRSLNKKIIIIYCDFNVINILYEKKIPLNDNIILYPDSTAVFFYIKMATNFRVKKYVSTNIQNSLLLLADKLKLKVYFFGDTESVLEKVRFNVSSKYPNIIIAGTDNGYNYETKEVISNVNNSKPDILFVGLGSGKQEPWIINNFKQVDVPFIMSVGGWFNFLGGTKKRAPVFFQQLHIEWLYKLTHDFSRLWRRYLLGVPIFFLRCLTGKIHFKIIESYE